MKNIFIVLMAVMLVACGDKESAAPSAKDLQDKVEKKPATTMILYNVIEPGIDPYQSRVIVTADFVRLDENNAEKEFVLVDRKKQIIYSVSTANDSILVVTRKPVDIQAPMKLELSLDKKQDAAAPQIDGKDVVQYIFKVNGESCNNVMIAEGLLMDATKALSNYRHILAGQHAATLQSVPADMRNACDMSTHIFHPARHLQYGLPVQESNYSGYKRNLADFDDDWVADPKLFILPPELGHFSIDGMHDGADAPATSADGEKASAHKG